MALSMKNTLISLSLSGMMLFAGFLAGEQPVIAASSFAINQGQPTTQSSNQNIANVQQVKKAKRPFTTPYFSFKRYNLPVGVR